MVKSFYKSLLKYIFIAGIFYLLSIANVKGGLRIFSLGFSGSLIVLCPDSIILSCIFVAIEGIATLSVKVTISSLLFTFIMVIGKLINNKLKITSVALYAFYFIVGCLPKIFFIFGKENIPSSIIFCLLSCGFFISCYVFLLASIKRKMYLKLNLDEIACGLIIFIGCFCGLYELNIPYIDLVRVFGCLLLLICCYCELDSLGLCLGTIFGIGPTLAGSGIGYISLFAVMAIMIKLFKSEIRFFSSLSVVAVDIIFGLYFDVFISYNLYNVVATIIAGAVFMLLPKKLFDYVIVNFSKPSSKMAYRNIINQNNMDISKKLLELSEVFFDMDIGFRKLVRGQLPLKDSKEMFVKELVQNCCESCDNYYECHRKYEKDTKQVFNSLADNGFEKGKITLLELPSYITTKCSRVNVMLPTINGLINQFKKNSQVMVMEDNSKILIAEQLRGISKLLYELSQKANEKLVFDNKKEIEIIENLTYQDIVCSEASVYEKDKNNYRVGLVVRNQDLQNNNFLSTIEKVCGHKLKITDVCPSLISGLAVVSLESCQIRDMFFGVAKASKDNSDECGDNYSILKFGSNKFLMAICDGMGNGLPAQDISEKATTLIENFYRAEFDSEIILSSVNKLLNLHNGEYFSTIDICSIDLSSGIVDFVKLGASASFIKHAETITKIESGSLPIGVLEEISPKITKTSLDFGDMVIIASDGVVDSIGEDELTQFILDTNCLAPQEMADKILEKAKTVCGGVPIDDMTVVVGKIFKNT